MSRYQVDANEVGALRQMIKSAEAQTCIFRDPVQAIALDELASRIAATVLRRDLAGCD